MLNFLEKNNTAPEAPVAPASSEPVKTLASRIRDYKSANPTATARQIGDALGTTSIYVYQCLGYQTKIAKKAKSPKKPEMLLASKNKTEGFAIGVTQPHYWVISALASGKKTTRTAILQTIIDQYIRDVLTEANQNGASV
jgi:hypothetical protein